MQSAQGKWNESIESCLNAIAFSQDALENPGIVSGMLSLAIQDTAVTSIQMIVNRDVNQSVDKEQWDRIGSELDRLLKMEGYRTALISERVANIESLKRSSVFMKYAARDYLDFMKDQIDHADVDSELPMVDGGSWMIQNLMPLLQSFHERQRRTCVLLRVARIQVALKQKPDADFDNLEALGLKPDVLQDPFSGNSLIVKRTENGCKIYSVGFNRADDQGDLTGPDIGLEMIKR